MQPLKPRRSGPTQLEQPELPSIEPAHPAEERLRSTSGAAFEDMTLQLVDAGGTGAPERSAKGLRTPRGATTALALTAKEEFLRAKVKGAMQASQDRADNRVMQQILPLWDDMRRAVPNPFLRSGLFGIGSPKERRFLNGEQLISMSNFELSYKGEELQQDDLSVWMSLMNLARAQRAADAVFFTGYQLIRDMDWRMHSESYARAKASIERLKANAVTVKTQKDKTAAYAGSLIREFAYYVEDGEESGVQGKWMVRFEPRIANLFMNDDVTFLWWEQRKAIGTKAALTLWLHGFYSSHTEPIPLQIDYLRKLSRSDNARGYDFRVRLRSSLETLVRIGCLESFQISGDMVMVKKAAFAVQAQRLAGKTRRAKAGIPMAVVATGTEKKK